MSSGRDKSTPAPGRRETFDVAVTENHRLADHTFEIRFQRPKGFDFLAGQKIGVMFDTFYRDYSLVGPRQSNVLAICVRRITGGALSPILAGAKAGDQFRITPAFGYFLYRRFEGSRIFSEFFF